MRAEGTGSRIETMKAQSCADLVAVVTGAAQGIGRAIAEELRRTRSAR